MTFLVIIIKYYTLEILSQSLSLFRYYYYIIIIFPKLFKTNFYRIYTELQKKNTIE